MPLAPLLRRMVQLQEHRTKEGLVLDLDPDTGLLYKPSMTEAYPDLFGKLTATGRVLLAGKADVYKVFESLRRMAGDENKMLQVRRARAGARVRPRSS
jgi:hypothetical protein